MKSRSHDARAVRKINSVNTSDRGGGAERIAWTLFKGFEQRGLESWLVVGDKKTADPRVMPIHASPFIDYRRYGAPEFQETLVQRKNAAAESGAFDFHFPFSHRLPDITGSEPDVVHLHNLHGGYFDLRAAQRISRRFPTFLTLEDCWWFSGHCAYPLGCNRWQTGCGECPLLHVPPEAKKRDATALNWKQKREIFRRCRFHVISPSHWLLKMAQRSILAPAIIEGHVIPHGVDLSVFRPDSKIDARRRLDIPDGAFVVMFAANAVKSNPFKDYATIHSAVSMLGAMGHDIIFLAVGENGPNLQFGSAQLRHVPFIESQPEMANHYQAADVYLHAAKNEAFGIVIAEALACGVPIVATAVDGIPEVFNDGDQGFHVPQGDCKAMATAVKRLMVNPELRKQMGADAVQRAVDRFDDKAMIEAYLALYRHAVNSS